MYIRIAYLTAKNKKKIIISGSISQHDSVHRLDLRTKIPFKKNTKTTDIIIPGLREWNKDPRYTDLQSKCPIYFSRHHRSIKCMRMNIWSTPTICSTREERVREIRIVCIATACTPRWWKTNPHTEAWDEERWWRKIPRTKHINLGMHVYSFPSFIYSYKV